MLLSPAARPAALALIALLTGPALAQKPTDKPRIANVLSGHPTVIYYVYNSNPDCTEKPPVEMRIVTPPKHGSADVVKEKGYSNWPKDDQRHPCNLIPRTVTKLYYKSNTEYTGRDDLTLEWFGSDGGYGTIKYTINVR